MAVHSIVEPSLEKKSVAKFTIVRNINAFIKDAILLNLWIPTSWNFQLLCIVSKIYKQ